MPNAFAGYPAPFIFDQPGGTKTQQLIWGDFVTLLNEDDGLFTKVRSRRTTGWMRKTDLQTNRLLEINFVDVGQGDGAFLVTPDDKFILIDAGEGDNMARFLSWRFNLRDHPDRVITINKAIISHSDQDHYKGFSNLFKSTQFKFDSVHHNCIVERAGAKLLGPRITLQGKQYLTSVITTHAQIAAFLGDPANVGTKQYPKMLKTALDSGRVTEITGLNKMTGFLPGFEANKPVSMKILAPVPEPITGAVGLRWFGGDGETKNGHSVVVRLLFDKVSVLLGGDLNTDSEEFLLGHYSNMDPDNAANAEAIVTAARTVFESDVAKACHHGSADFTDLFLRAVNPIATIISSGDDESHAHPRPDTLGALGKAGRGSRPLLFSTELARSANENIKSPKKLREEINQLIKKKEEADSIEEKQDVQEEIDAALSKLERSVAVYGLINLRTDGKKVMLAQKLERPRPTTREEWDVHRLEPDANGALRYIVKD
jgi:beta-lactamase superfamily II metal-dependent hydrolase